MESMSLGTTLRDARRKLGITQEQLADEIHVSRKTISNWENDRFEPDYKALMHMCEVLGLDGNRLFALTSGKNAQESPGVEALPPEACPPLLEPDISDAREEDEVPVQAARPVRTRPIWPLSALVLLGALLILLWHPWQQKTSYSAEWFQQEAVNVPGQAYIRLSSHDTPIPLHKTAANLPRSWAVNIVLKEENGIGCTIHSVLRCMLDEKGRWTEQPLPGDFFGQRLHSGESFIGPNEFRRLSFSGIDNPRPVGLGLLIQGVDYEGNEVAFRAWFPFV